MTTDRSNVPPSSRSGPPSSRSAHPSSLAIDGLAGGRVGEVEARDTRAHVETCERCRDDLARATAACATFTREVFPRTVGNLRPPRPWWRSFAPALLVPVLAVLALVLWRRSSPSGAHELDTDLRIKGGMSFQVFARRGTEVFPVRDLTRLASGDQVRFVVGSGGPAFLIVASIDGAGNATIYYPYNGEQSGPVGAEPGELPASIELDSAPGPERVFALVSSTPIEAAVVKRALVTLGKRGPAAIRETRMLDVPGSAQSSIVFEKVVSDKATP